MEPELDGDVLWDVVEECLDEAAFTLASIEAGFDSATTTLDHLERTLEPRLRALLEAVVDSNPVVADRLLAPALMDVEGDCARATAAGLIAIEMGRIDLVEGALAAGSHAAQRALILAAPSSWDARVLRALAGELGARHRAGLLGYAAARRLDAGNLLAPMQSDDPDELLAATRAARWADPGLHGRIIEAFIHHGTREVADAALIAALHMSSRSALRACLLRAADPARAQPVPLLLLALFGDASDQRTVLHALDKDSQREAALFALGFSGSVDVIPSILALLTHEQSSVRKLAAEAFGTLTGLDVRGDAYVLPELPVDSDDLPPLEEDLASDLVPTSTDALPLPNADALRAWWSEHARRFDGHGRLLLGGPWTAAQCVSALERLPMRSRHPLALWLDDSMGGASHLDTRALVSAQRRQLALAKSASERALARGAARW